MGFLSSQGGGDGTPLILLEEEGVHEVILHNVKPCIVKKTWQNETTEKAGFRFCFYKETPAGKAWAFFACTATLDPRGELLKALKNIVSLGFQGTWFQKLDMYETHEDCALELAKMRLNHFNIQIEPSVSKKNGQTYWNIKGIEATQKITSDLLTQLSVADEKASSQAQADGGAPVATPGLTEQQDDIPASYTAPEPVAKDEDDINF